MVDDLVSAVKAKKELSNLDDEFVRTRVLRVLDSDARIREKYEKRKDSAQFMRSKEYAKILKSVRKDLREIYGVFQVAKRHKVTEENLHDVLSTHISTRERLPFYDLIYKELSNRIPAPKVLLDLGCGLNPLTYQWMRRHGWAPFIIGVDISKADMQFLGEAMEHMGIPGKTHALDITQSYGELANIAADVTLVLKLVDTLESIERHVTRRILDYLPSKWIVVSFATRSLGGKKRIPMKGRGWFERVLQRKKLRFTTFSVENEFFYIIDKSL